MTSFTPRMLESGRICCSSPDALCAKCQDHVAYKIPDPYKAGVEAFRAANATETSRFEERYKAERHAALDAEHARHAARIAANPTPRLTTAELEEYAAPDPYKAGIAAWQKENR